MGLIAHRWEDTLWFTVKGCVKVIEVEYRCNGRLNMIIPQCTASVN